VEGDASRRLYFIFRQQQAAVGWRVMARKFCKLLLKVLKAELHAQRLLVLQEKFPHLGNLRRRFRLHKYKS
jgi:hypothetical protein